MLPDIDAMTFVVAAPFVAAALAPFARRLLGHNAGWALAVVPLAMAVIFASHMGEVAGGAVLTFGIDWLPAYGVRLSYFIDGLSLVFALLITVIGTFILVYTGGYLKGHPQQGRFFSFILLFMGAMLGLVVADDLISLFVYWELTSITSFLLIGFDHTRTAARRGAFQALVITGIGGLALLGGVLLMRAAGGATTLSELLATGEMLRESASYLAILILVLIAAFTKSAQWPLHAWLPNAMEAPTPVSAFLHSATMVKAGVYLLMRLQPVLGGTPEWTGILPAVGAVTLVAGALLAIRQTDLKRILAYTTMGSLGLLVMLTGTSNETAIFGAVAYLVAHAAFKGALFMVAGTVDHEAGTRDLTRLRGLRRAMPVTFAAAAVAFLSMAGLPPLLGFVAKEVFYEGLLDPGIATVYLVAAVAGSALMLAAGAAVALRPFLGRAPDALHAHEGPPALWLGPVLLAGFGLVAAVALGASEEYLLAPMAGAVLGHAPAGHLHLFPSAFTAPVWLSIGTVAAGFLVYWQLDRLRAVLAAVLAFIRVSPDRAFDHLVAGLVLGASSLTRLVQNGRLSVYSGIALATLAAGLLVPQIVGGELPGRIVIPVGLVHEWAVFALVAVGILAMLTARTRLVAIVAMGIQGFAVAVIFMLYGAPDLSFTQFMVETVSVVILALVMTRLKLGGRDRRPVAMAVPHAILGVAVGVGIAAVLIGVTAQPFDTSLADFFIANAYENAHGRNVVNVILVDFRGIDTLGEIAVVAAAGVAILGLVRLSRRRRVTVVGDTTGESA